MRWLLRVGVLLAVLVGPCVFALTRLPVRRSLGQYQVVRTIYWWIMAFMPASQSSQSTQPPFRADLRMIPDLPKTYLNTTYAPSPCSQTVAANGNLQAALDAANPGDTICLAAGARFTGHFVLRKKAAGTRWIVLRTATPDAEFIAPDTRVSPGDAPRMPVIVTPDIEPAIAIESQAHHYRLIGLNLTGSLLNRRNTLYTIVQLGGSENTEARLPHDIIVDRCYIHGLPEANVRRDVTMNAARVAIINSYLSEAHEPNGDSQAIECWNGPGPFKIVNNYLEGAGENVMFGGATPSIPIVVPADIEIRHNYFFKPLEWKKRTGDDRWIVKNLFELKNARRVLMDGNIFENSWISSQDGTAILFNGVDGPASLIEDITMTNNIVRNSATVITGTANSYSPQLRPTNTILIRNNLFVEIRPGNALNLYAGLANVTIDHNTVLQEGGSFLSCGDYSPVSFADHYVISNNIANFGNYGIINLNLKPPILRDEVITNNVFVARPAGWAQYYTPYPNNYFPDSREQVGFAGDRNGDFRLSRKSPYRGKGSDGKDPGVDMDALQAAVRGVEAGQPAPSGSRAGANR